MSDLRVVAEIIAKPGSEDVIREVLSQLASATQSEDGCNSYELFESAAVPGIFFTLESWHSQAALDAHLQTDHVAAAFAVAGEHVSAAPAIHPLTAVES